MIDHFKGKTAVLTGAGSGFGLECARIGARLGMNLVLVDVQQDALDKAAAEMQAAGAQVLARKVDVSSAEQMQALAAAVKERFGAPHFVFNNAGVGSGGLVWENSLADWQWVLGVNVWGVIHGVHLFTPMMLEAAKADPAYRGHIVNTASMAGLLTPPNMGVYNVTKHAVVSLTETLYQDLALVPLIGHTRGHCGVAVRTDQGWLLHAGDAYFHHTQLRDPAQTPLGIRLFEQAVQTLPDERRANLAALQTLSRQTDPALQIFSAHDVVEFERLSGSAVV